MLLKINYGSSELTLLHMYMCTYKISVHVPRGIPRKQIVPTLKVIIDYF